MEIKPKTLQDYRHLITRHVKPHIGGMALQAIRPAWLTRLYRDLATTEGRNGTRLSPRTVEYVHAILHKALRDAVVVDHTGRGPGGTPSRTRAGSRQRRRPGHDPDRSPGQRNLFYLHIRQVRQQHPENIKIARRT